MRVVPFPTTEERAHEAAWLAELEAALSGEDTGADAASWRELRADVRSLAPPIDPQFEDRLRGRLSRPARRRPRIRMFAWAGAPALAAILIALVIAGPLRPGGSGGLITPRSSKLHAGAVSSSSAGSLAASPVPNEAAESAPAEHSASEPPALSSQATSVQENRATPFTAETGRGAAAAPGRVQQVSASVTLGTDATGVQALADRVSRLVVSDGGFVQSSQVQEQSGGSNEATLTLKLPSAKLGAAIAALGRLAPVRAESQSLQDITDTYDSARRRLTDAEAEHAALLRALPKAATQQAIDELHAQLAQARQAIARAKIALAAVTRRADTAEVGVTVLGDAHAKSQGLTLHRGLHDAGRVLLSTAVVLLVAAAVLVPLGLVIAVLLGSRAGLRRRRREHVLQGD